VVQPQPLAALSTLLAGLLTARTTWVVVLPSLVVQVLAQAAVALYLSQAARVVLAQLRTVLLFRFKVVLASARVTQTVVESSYRVAADLTTAKVVSYPSSVVSQAQAALVVQLPSTQATVVRLPVLAV
jgi:hypothetical protein